MSCSRANLANTPIITHVQIIESRFGHTSPAGNTRREATRVRLAATLGALYARILYANDMRL